MEEISKSEEKGLPQRSLLYWMIALVIFGLVISNVGINLIWLESFLTSIREKNVDYLLSEAKRSAESIEKFIDVEMDDVKRLSGDITISQEADFFIDRFLKENPAMSEASIINLDGKEAKRYSRKEYFGKEDLRNFSSLEEFEKAKEGHAFISNVEFSPAGEPYIKIATPVRKLEIDEPQAVLRVVFNLKGSWEKILEMRIGETGRVSVIDDKGMLIADPDPSRVLRKINLLNLPPTRSLINGEIFEGAKYLNEEGKEIFGVGTPIESLKWGIIVEQDTRELEAAAKEIEVLVIIILIAGAIIIGVLIWLNFILRKADRGLLERYYTIGNQSQKLKEAKTSLEIRIQARTKELEELTEKLEGQIEKRTRELQDKIRESEKFNRLAVGRELKMIELKEEIKRLKEELMKYTSQKKKA